MNAHEVFDIRLWVYVASVGFVVVISVARIATALTKIHDTLEVIGDELRNRR